MGALLPVLLQAVLSNPTAMGWLSSVVSNPALVQQITHMLTGLSTQVGQGTPLPVAMQNLILSQFDLDQAAAAVAAEMKKLGLPALTLDQEREMAAVVIRNYIANVKAGK